MSISGERLLCEKPTQPIVDTLSFVDFIGNQLVFQLPTNSTSNSYEHVRNKALNQLLLDFIVKNSNFLFDNDLKEILDTNLMQNLPYVYNALNSLKLNTKETMDLIKLKLKQFVMCSVCNSRVNWNLNADLEQKNCLNKSADNWYMIIFIRIITNLNILVYKCIIFLIYLFSKNEVELTKSLFGKLITHITQHNENIDKVKLSESHLINEFKHS